MQSQKELKTLAARGAGGTGKESAPAPVDDDGQLVVALPAADPVATAAPVIRLPAMLPPTADCNLARLRWHSTQFAMQQMHLEAVKLRRAVDALLSFLIRRL